MGTYYRGRVLGAGMGLFLPLVMLPTPVEASTSDHPALIRYSNHAPSWPVGHEARLWNRNGKVRLVRVSSCSGLDGCVEIRSGRLPLVTDGETVFAAATPVRVVLNLRYAGSGWTHREQTVCHELGHVLGLDHRTGDSCMNRYVNDRHPVPTPGDLDRVRSLW